MFEFTTFEVVPGNPRRVIVTEGSEVDGRQIYGVFADAADVIGPDADEKAIAIIGPASLSQSQREQAARNSASF